MLYWIILINILKVLLLILPVLIVIAFVTIAERKTMASVQRRLGPNVVGVLAILQPFADVILVLPYLQ